MTDQHQVDVGVRALILQAARARLELVREAERAEQGVPSTTLSDVGRAILYAWEPGRDQPVENLPVTQPGERGQVGHRKFPVATEQVLSERTNMGKSGDKARAREIAEVLEKIAANPNTTAISKLNQVERAVRAEKLGKITVRGVTVARLIARCRRAVLPPFRFTVARQAYERIYEQMCEHNTTVTRVLEDGLTRFASTGNHQATEE